MASGLASIIGGLAQGITDFGKSAADMFGGAATNNALTVGLDALLNKKSLGQASADARQRQNDYRKWLYDTDSTKDAAAKGLGTALNGAQAVMDFVPGIGQSAPVNALQGAIGGLADEFKFNGENYDLGRAAGRAAIGAGANVAAGGLGKALANSGSKVLSNGVLRGAAAGGLSGAISQGGNAAIEGGNADQILQSAAQGAKFGALMGAGTGGVQTLAGALKNARARNNAPAIMDEEVVMAEMAPDYSNRIAEAQAEIENIGRVSLFSKNPEDVAKRARIRELEQQIKAYNAGYDTPEQYEAAWKQRNAENAEREAKARAEQEQAQGGQDYFMAHRPTKSGAYGYDITAGGEEAILPADAYDNLGHYTGFKQPGYIDETITQLRAARNNPDAEMTIYRATPGDTINDGDWITLSKAYADEHNRSQLGGKGNVLSQKVPAKDIQFAGDDLMEWGYFPQNEINAPKIEEQVMADRAAPEQSAVADAMLSPEQREFFKDSVLRDPQGNLMRVYHSSPNKFTEFDDARLGSNTAYDNTAFGHFVTNDRDFSSRFRDIDNRGIDGYTMELYANAKKPITHPYEAAYKYSGDELDNIVKNYYKETDNPEALEAIKEWADESGQSLYDAYMDMSVDENPFEMAAAERQALQGKGYDAVEFVEGRKSGLVDGSNDDTPISSYAIFSGNQLKDINNLTPTDNENIMAERAAPGQLGLFDQTATKAPETGYSQLGLFDQPTQPVTPKTIDVADVNPYAPVNGQVTQTMRDRAADIMANYKNGLPENELYNRINPETMPTSGIDVIARQADGLKPKARKEFITKALFGNKNIEDATMDELFDVYYADNPQRRASMEAKIQQVRDANYYGPELKNTIIENTRKNFVKNVKTAINKASEATSSRNGFTGAADAVLSERLGIAPGNTNKRQLRHDSDKTTYGRYRPDAKEISITEKFPTPENAISTMAHERLHSFQHEADAQGGRYAEDVKNAYKELQKDLLPLLHGRSRIRKDHARNLDYYGSRIEQESRMLQDYLDQKGYTDSKRIGRGEYGEEINPAFDKFFDKLRELSKKGVALPAILATLGLGGYATQNQEEDKDNGQQI